MNKILGVVLIFISIGIVANIIPGSIALVGELMSAISNNTGGYWGAFTASLLIQSLGWIIAYYCFRYGRNLYRS